MIFNRRSPLARLLEAIPLVYLGPGALQALERGRGVLLGAKRPGWIDALGFEPVPGANWKELVELRFDLTAEFEPVGIVLQGEELSRLRQALARELAPGDVVLVPGERARPRAYLNRGDRLWPAPLNVSRARSPTSTRRRRPRR